MTVVSLGREDIVQSKQMRQGYTFAIGAKGALEQLVTEGERWARQPMAIEEFRYRLKYNHVFILTTPGNLVRAVAGLEPWEYDTVQREVRKELIAKRKMFYNENVLVTVPGRDIMLNIREAVMKILCLNCGQNYRYFNLYVQNFDTAGCDDIQGATTLKQRLCERAN